MTSSSIEVIVGATRSGEMFPCGTSCQLNIVPLTLFTWSPREENNELFANIVHLIS